MTSCALCFACTQHAVYYLANGTPAEYMTVVLLAKAFNALLLMRHIQIVGMAVGLGQLIATHAKPTSAYAWKSTLSMTCCN